jgi:hypothetical protein
MRLRRCEIPRETAGENVLLWPEWAARRRETGDRVVAGVFKFVVGSVWSGGGLERNESWKFKKKVRGKFGG